MKLWQRFRWWRLNRKMKREIWYVLSWDQANHGFDHTVNEIMLWLCSCVVFRGHLKLYVALGKHIEEVNAMRERSESWHNDDITVSPNHRIPP